MLNGNKHIPRSVLALLSRESWVGARCRKHPGKVVEMNQGIQQRDCSKKEGSVSRWEDFARSRVSIQLYRADPHRSPRQSAIPALMIVSTLGTRSTRHAGFAGAVVVSNILHGHALCFGFDSNSGLRIAEFKGLMLRFQKWWAWRDVHSPVACVSVRCGCGWLGADVPMPGWGTDPCSWVCSRSGEGQVHIVRLAVGVI